MSQPPEMNPELTLQVADEVTNIIMDFMRETHGTDPDSDIDDSVYTHGHTLINHVMDAAHTHLLSQHG
jgi:hypothetical protein